MRQEMIDKLRHLDAVELRKVSERDQLAAQCDHRKPNRKSALFQVDGGNTYECSICKTRVRMQAFSIEEANKNVEAVNQMVQHIKINATDLNENTLKELGQFTIVLKDIPRIYKNATKDNAYKAQKFQKQQFNGGANANQMAALFGGLMGGGTQQFGYAGKKGGNWSGHR